MAWLELYLSKCCRASICQCSHISIRLPGTISLFKGYMAGFLFLSHNYVCNLAKYMYVLIGTVFIRLSALAAYLIFGPSGWVLIRGGRLFEAGRLLN